MTDVYRTAALICPACASPMREFQRRLVCDACEGMLLGIEDFATACADLVGRDAPVEVHDRPRARGRRSARAAAPRSGPAGSRVAGKKLRGRFSVRERDGLWFARDVLPGVFAMLTRTLIGYVGGYKPGDHTRKMFQSASRGDAADGLTITAWRNRPRRHAQTMSPVNAYRERRPSVPDLPDRAPVPRRPLRL